MEANNKQTTEKIQTGRIYCLRSPNTDKIYVGSTFCNPKLRFIHHRLALEYFTAGRTAKKSTAYEIMGAGEAYIDVLKTFVGISKKQLRRHEGETIQSMENCVNKLIPGRTRHEHYMATRDLAKAKEKSREYYQTEGKRQITCECGAVITRQRLTKHVKTAHHKKFLEVV